MSFSRRCAMNVHRTVSLPSWDYRIQSSMEYCGMESAVWSMFANKGPFNPCDAISMEQCIPLDRSPQQYRLNHPSFYSNPSLVWWVSKEDLSHLVKLAGGSVLTREPRGQEDTTHVCPYHAKPQSPFFSSHTFIVYDSHVENSPAKPKTSSVVTVPSLWLLDCLSHFELVDTPVL